MLHFEGDRDLAPAPEIVTQRLGDAGFLATCVPGIEGTPHAEAQRVAFRVRPGLSFIKGTLDITVQVTEVTPGSQVRYNVHGKGIGTSNEVEAELQITPRDGGSRVHWVADITRLGGLLKAVPQGLIQAAAQKVIDDVWNNVVAKMAAG